MWILARNLKWGIALLLGTTAPSAFCQGNPRDSIRSLLNASPNDTSKVLLLYRYGELLENTLPDSALWYYSHARQTAEQLHFEKGKAAYASHAIVILNNRGKFKEALELSREALRMYEEIGDSREIARALINVGSEWHYLSDFQQATDYYLQALRLAEEVNDLLLQRVCNNNLAAIFISLQDYHKGKEYALRSLEIATSLKNEYAISSSTYNIATAELHLKQYRKALEHYAEIEKIGQATNDNMVIQDGWLGMADVYNALEDNRNALLYYNKVIAFSRKQQTPEYEMYAYMGLADLAIRNGQLEEAEQHITKGIASAQEMGSSFELKDLYLKASEVFEKKGSLEQALLYRKKYEALHDTIMGEKSKSNISMLEAKFESENKESMINRLEAEKKIQQLSIQKKNILNYVLIGASLSILLVSLLFYRNYRHKQRLQQQRISELEKEKQLAAAEAVLKGEEQERTRLAKDLHDGLGGMLSGIKFGFQTMQASLTMTPSNSQAFERSMDMLDSSIREMRRVAHNMMPESLVRFGLDTALQDFCNEINTSGALQITYQSLGMTGVQLDQTLSITLYRIVQELLNNTMKHAYARSSIVQLTKTSNLLILTIEDDGRGFDPEDMERSNGMGWQNIRNRVDFLKGELNLITGKGKGTSVQIEITL